MNVKVGEFHLCDRSIFVGRHTNTGEFNPKVSPLRSAINSLHAQDIRTDLTELIFDYQPHPEHPHINRFFQNLQAAWNALVFGCIESLDMWRNPEKLLLEPPIEQPPIVLDMMIERYNFPVVYWLEFVIHIVFLKAAPDKLSRI